jgi:hypothetical protein
MPFPTSNAALFYQSLANAIDSAAGDIFLNLNPGRWQTIFAGKPYIWVIPNNCIMEIQFQYVGGVLQSATVTFTPPVQVVLPDGAGTITVNALIYNQLGDVTGSDITTNPPEVDAIAMTRANRVLAMQRNPKSVFVGLPLQGFTSVTRVDATNQPIEGSGSIVARVRFEKTEGLPGLKVTFRNGALIKFSDSSIPGSPYNNNIVVGTGSGFEFNEIDYTVDESILFGSLANFNAAVNSGMFSSTDFLFQLRSGSQLQFSNIDFSRDNAGVVSIDATFGTLSASLGGGSRINLSTGPVGTTSTMVFDDGSQVSLIGYRLKLGASAVRVEVSGGSSLNVQVHSGRLALKGNDFLGFESGKMNANFNGTWDSQEGITVNVHCDLFTVTGADGEIAFTADTRLLLNNGTLDSSAMVYQTGVGCTVNFDRFAFNIGENSLVGFGNGLQLTAAAGGSFVGASPGTPFQIAPAQQFPMGNFSLILPFKKLYNAKSPTFSLQNGSATLNVISNGDGSASAENCSFSGTMIFTTADLSAMAQIQLRNISLSVSANGAFTLQGNVAGSIPANQSITIVTPYTKTDGFYYFPVTLVVTIANDLIIPQTSFSMTDAVVTLDQIRLQPSFKVQIPPGLGEHEDKDDPNSANGEHGPDEDKRRQEVLQKTTGLTIHIYLVSAGYDITSQFTIEITNNVLSVDLQQMRLAVGEVVAYSMDGGDFGVLGAIAGAIVGTVLLGDPALGAITGAVAGEDFNQALNDFIATYIAQKITTEQFSWRSQI